MDIWSYIVNNLYQWVFKIKTKSILLFYFLFNSTPDAASSELMKENDYMKKNDFLPKAWASQSTA